MPINQLLNRLREHPRLGAQRLAQWTLPQLVTALLMGMVIVGPVLLHQQRWQSYALFTDDFDFLANGIEWSRTQHSLWSHFNGHFCPSFRLLTWSLFLYSGNLADVHLAFRMSSIVAVLLVQSLLILFFRNELGTAIAGLTAAVLFGFSSVYVQAVQWYSASAFLWSLASTLGALIAFQLWNRQRSLTAAVIGIFIVAMAPTWNAMGVLSGLYCGIYLFFKSDGCSQKRRLLRAGLPLAGTLLYLALLATSTTESLPKDLSGRSITEAFQPGLMVTLGLRSFICNLFRNLAADVELTLLQAGVIGIAILTLAYRLSWARERLHLLWLGVAVIALGYVFILWFRNDFGFRGIQRSTRYNTFTQFGLIFILSARFAFRPRTNPDRLFCSELLGLSLAGVCLFALHLPVSSDYARSFPSATATERPYDQQSRLANLDLLQQIIDRERISQASLEAALGRYDIPGTVGFKWYRVLRFPKSSKNWDPVDLGRRLKAVFDAGSSDAF